MSGSGSSSPKQTTATTSSYEQKVIVDLQAQLTRLAQQNRESIAKALSAAEAIRPTSPPENNSTMAHSATTTCLPLTTDAVISDPAGLPSVLPSSSHPVANLPESYDSSCDPHPLNPSKSSPADYPSVVPDVPLSLPMGEGHQRVHSAEDFVLLDPLKTQLNNLVLPAVPPTKPANRSLLEKQLEDTKAQVLHLDTKLKECNDICEQQKLHFRTAIVDLQTKLNDTIVGRNSVMELRRKEAESQERLISQLQRTFTDVEATNQQQAQVLQDASTRIASLHGELQACTACLTKINTLAVDRATKRGFTLVHKTAFSGPMDVEQVMNTVRVVLEGYEKELGEMGQKVVKAERGLAEAQEQFAERWRQNGEDQKQMLRRLRDEQEKQLSEVTERALNARKQTLSLQSQLALTQEQMQKQLDAKTSHVTELQGRLERLQVEAETTRKALHTKCNTLSSDLEAAGQQHRTDAEEKNQLLDQIQSLQQQLCEANKSIAKAETDLETVGEQRDRLAGLEQEATMEVNDLKAELEEKTKECAKLTRLVEKVKEDSVSQMEARVLELEENNSLQMRSLTDNMTSQISDISRKCDRLSADLKLREKELEDTLKSKEELKGALGVVRQELQQVTEEKTDLILALDDRGRELEAVGKEKEHLAVLLEERSHKLDSLQSTNNQLQVQVTEKDQQCSRLQDQASGLAQLAEVTRKASEEWAQERSLMKETLDGQAKELQDMKLHQESLTRKLKIREKRLKNVEEDNKRLQEKVQGTAKESESAVRSQEELATELQQTKTQVDLMTIEQEKLKAEVLEKDEGHRRDISRYKSRIKMLQKELETAHKTIQATTATDGRAVQVAESMQKQVTAKRSEIDTLQSEIHWLKECLDVTRKEKLALVGERDQYKAQVSEMNKNNENLMKEQEKIKDRRSEQSSLVAKLEESLKKAATKHAECKAVIERQEQDIARLKLKHQLEMKELQRAATRTSPPTSIPSKPSSQKNTPTEQMPAIMKKDSSAPTANKDISEHSRRSSSDRTRAKGMKELAKGTIHSGVTTKEKSSSDGRPQKDLTQSVQPVAPVVSKAAAEKDRPLSHGRGTQTSSIPTDALTKLLTDEELRSLLHEMYGVVSGRPSIPKDQVQPWKINTATAKQLTSPGNPVRSQEAGKRNSRESGYSTRSMDREGWAGKTAPLLTSSPVHDRPTPEPGNLSLLSSVAGTGDTIQVLPEPDFLLRPRSPVADLLGSSPHGVGLSHSANDSHNNNSQAGPVRFTPFENMGRSRAPDSHLNFVDDDGTSETTLGSIPGDGDFTMETQNEKLRLLQDKLQNLRRMGGHLQKENKDMAVMIKRQDTRIRKCRQQEQSFNQLARKGR